MAFRAELLILLLLSNPDWMLLADCFFLCYELRLRRGVDWVAVEGIEVVAYLARIDYVQINAMRGDGRIYI